MKNRGDRGLVFFISWLGFWFWQALSQVGEAMFPTIFLKTNCRFTPTCSRYAQLAISHYGMIHGLGLTVRRLLRCHPFSKGGHDPIT